MEVGRDEGGYVSEIGAPVPSDWSVVENEAIVADYFDMLSREEAGLPINKAAHRRRLSGLLDDRSDGAIERKRMNISAILEELHRDRIKGYQPLINYQFSLFEAVVQHLARNGLMPGREQASDSESSIPRGLEVLHILERAPKRKRPASSARERVNHPYRLPETERSPAVQDYLHREAMHRDLGLRGERLTLEFEHYRLWKSGAKQLADKVKHVSSEIGDYEGFDIYSYETTGAPRLIEVKTTNHHKSTPFFISRHELEVSRANEDTYHLYRLFRFSKGPGLFVLKGAVDRTCTLDPVQFVGMTS